MQDDFYICSGCYLCRDLRDDPADGARVVHAAVIGGVSKGLVHGGGDVNVGRVAAHALVDGIGTDRLAIGGDAHGSALARAAVQDARVDGDVHAAALVWGTASRVGTRRVADPGDLAAEAGTAERGRGRVRVGRRGNRGNGDLCSGGGGGDLLLGGGGRLDDFGGAGGGLDDGRLGRGGGGGGGGHVGGRRRQRAGIGSGFDDRGAGGRGALEELAGRGRGGGGDGGQGGWRDGRLSREVLGGGSVNDLGDGLGDPDDLVLGLEEALVVAVVVVDATGVLVGVSMVRLRDDRRGQAGENETDGGLHDCWERIEGKCDKDADFWGGEGGEYMCARRCYKISGGLDEAGKW